MQNKYFNVKTKASDGMVFDSTKEARRYEQLILLQRAGEISDLKRQVEYELIPNQYETYERYSKTGKRLEDGKKLIERKVVYVADFVYTTKTGEVIVEDAKGFRTKDFILKRKLLLFRHGIKLREV